MIRKPKPLLIIVIFLLSLFFPFRGLLFAETDIDLPKPFTDLPSNILYHPSIELFRLSNIIVGDTLGGEPIGRLRPKDHLQRAEFTKVATMVHLLEEKKEEGSVSDYLNIGLNEFTLKTDALLRPYYSSRPGTPKFSDVPEKELNCAMDPGGCEPWFTQYVNYMADFGTIKGFAEDNTFRPNNTLLRIHALKMVMAKNGNVPAEEDVKFRRLEDDERVKGRQPRCLTGAEDYILEASGGAGLLDARNLLAYALLADKLDVFGNQCQAFTNKGISLNNKKTMADFLQQPLTRQEVARLFSLTTTIPNLQLDPSSDPTVDSKNEYSISYDPVAMKESEAKKKAEEEAKKEAERKKADESKKESAKIDEEDETGPPYGTHPLTKEDLLKYFPDGNIPEKTTVAMPFDLKLAISKTGRCCKTKDLYPSSNCKVIDYADYSVSEEDDYNWETYEGPSWHEAKGYGESCWIPLPDIMVGYGEGEVNRKDLCGHTPQNEEEYEEFVTACIALLKRKGKSDEEIALYLVDQGLLNAGVIEDSYLLVSNGFDLQSPLFKTFVPEKYRKIADGMQKIAENPERYTEGRRFKSNTDGVNIRNIPDSSGYKLKTIPGFGADILVIGDAVKGE